MHINFDLRLSFLHTNIWTHTDKHTHLHTDTLKHTQKQSHTIKHKHINYTHLDLHPFYNHFIHFYSSYIVHFPHNFLHVILCCKHMNNQHRITSSLNPKYNLTLCLFHVYFKIPHLSTSTLSLFIFHHVVS